jgi:hypothetical protein
VTPDRAAELKCGVGIAPGTFAERLARTSPQAHVLYRAMLPTVAGTGTPQPLAAAAKQAGLPVEQAAEALRELAAVDVVALDTDGNLVGAFPLSAVPTRHQVHLGDGRLLHAMCAVDALGIPAMLGQPGVVVSTDPTTGETITVRVSDRGIDVDPPGAVVLLATAGAGTLASSCCTVIDFYAAADQAHRALDGPGVTGDVLTVGDAHALGVALFADLPAR